MAVAGWPIFKGLCDVDRIRVVPHPTRVLVQGTHDIEVAGIRVVLFTGYQFAVRTDGIVGRRCAVTSAHMTLLVDPTFTCARNVAHIVGVRNVLVYFIDGGWVG